MARTVSFLQRISVLALIAGLMLTLVPTPAHAVDSRTETRIRNQIENRINQARENNGLAPLKANKRMRRFAKDHSGSMANRGELFHDTLDRIRIEVIDGAIGWGENVGRTSNADGAKTVHSLFMGSPLHRANILDLRYTHMGVGVVKKDGFIWVTQRFAQANPGNN